jgi:hypothetical protein
VKKRSKTVIAGSLVKVVIYTPPMPRDNPQQRAARHRATTAAQKRLNHISAQAKLEFKLAANFSYKDYFITFTYAKGNEPKGRREVNRHKAQYVRRIRNQRSRRRQVFKWVFAPEHKHGKGRWHLHAVINAADPRIDIDEIKSLWPYGHVEISRLFDQKHRFSSWGSIARYMTKERPEDGKDTTPVGAQIYSCSRNLAPPVVRSEWINDGELPQIPDNAIVLEREESQNEFSRFTYFKYMTAPLFEEEKKHRKRPEGGYNA